MKPGLRNIFRLLIALFVLGSLGCGNKSSGKEYAVTPANDNYRVYYEIFVGAYSDSDNDGIGDLKGLLNRLDYLNDGKPNSGKGLGIEGIWLMPIMPSPSYHKYDVSDYKDIDPLYGSIEDFENLAAECNKRGIKIIIDLVLNHTSTQHPWFLNAKKAVREGNPDSQYVKYYTIGTERLAGRIWYPLERSPDGTQYYYEGNFSPDMPELDLDNPELRREITEIARFWFGKGAGGFRLDAVKFFSLGDDLKNIEFLKWLNIECKKIKDDVYIVAENWSAISSILSYYEAVNCFDFQFAEGSGYVAQAARGRNSVSQYTSRLETYQNLVLERNPNAITNPFISNHDMDRAAGYLTVDDHVMQVAANLYMLSCGSPFIYYGEEIGMKGNRGNTQTDANRRLAMLWGDGDTVRDPMGSTFDKANQTNGTVKGQLSRRDSLLNHYKKLIRLRRANPEIARGTVKALDFSDYNTFGGFVSDYMGSKVGVFHNTGEDEIIVDLRQYTDENFSAVSGYAGKGRATLKGTVLTLSGFT
ncbi:MAG: hypothetical protein LBI06_06770, partial [Treponema sp.]|nr:hypothetical protein [Treponema sp.]